MEHIFETEFIETELKNTLTLLPEYFIKSRRNFGRKKRIKFVIEHGPDRDQLI